MWSTSCACSRSRGAPEAGKLHAGLEREAHSTEDPQELVRERHVAGAASVRRSATRVDATNRLCVEADADREAEAATFHAAEADPSRAARDDRVRDSFRRGTRITRQPERAREHVRPAARERTERNVRRNPVQHLVDDTVASECDDGVCRTRRELARVAATFREHRLDVARALEHRRDLAQHVLAHARRERVRDQQHVRHAAMLVGGGR